MATRGRVTNVNDAGRTTAPREGQGNRQAARGRTRAPDHPREAAASWAVPWTPQGEAGHGTATAERPARGRTRSGSGSARSPEDLTITPTPEAGSDLAGRARRINQHHDERLNAFRTSLEHARAAATSCAVKEAVGHSKFQKSIKDNFAFSDETAANYMRIAKHWVSWPAGRSKSAADCRIDPQRGPGPPREAQGQGRRSGR